MKTIIVSTFLAAASLGASAMDYNIDWHSENSAKNELTRAEVKADYLQAKAAGKVPITEFQNRQADRLMMQAPSTLTRKQVRQEIATYRGQIFFDTHGH
ncbi:MAG: DUF4148 domain-containing protein [Rhodoferax sp.]|nr:DUF4148 domain-containing protein [Betaproteobacteria bacterium]NCN96216.1 DUF4148 domain-containing protein [Rhodoferax sp.]PIZ22696.1 MAG: hypothetical protein COY49_07195 [Comamonadaceae bacterium CG_4_10_14_0_8_um_filter_57_29]PJC21017.1 MAG: hypothetical protein CO065_04250 [Comamonadaceae bacterium CG_4_9_14_0_8_um_filter_57_21]NCP82856.1 DUF4148 domain-containing protein [Rhodoferax sp.]